MAEHRNFVNLQNIATTGFDQPLSLNSLSLSDPSYSLPVNHGMGGDASKNSETSEPTRCRMDHPKLSANGVFFLKGVDLSIAGLAGELGFAEALATRSNPTSVDNVHRKLTVMPPNYFSFTKEQQEAFCKLVDFAEMKQALRLELKHKEKTIREQEMKYLTTDYGLGNVVHGWDITNPSGTTGTERQASSTRLASRRKVKDSDRIFSSSSVMSFLASSRICKTKRLESMKKRRRNREKLEKERKKQQSLHKRRLNAFRDDRSADTEESYAGDETYAMSGRDSEDDERAGKKSNMKKKPTTAKKVKKHPDSLGAGKVSPVSRMPKLMPAKPDKPASETGHRLRTLLTNKTPHAASTSSLFSTIDTSPVPTKEPIKLKIMKSRLLEPTSDVPASPAPSAVTIDSGPDTSDSPLSKRNRGRPKRLDI